MNYVQKIGLAFMTCAVVTVGVGCGGSGGGSNSTAPHTADGIGDGLPAGASDDADNTPSQSVMPSSQIFLGDGASLAQIEAKFGLTPVVLMANGNARDSAKNTRSAETPQSPNDYKQICIDRMIQYSHAMINFRGKDNFPGAPEQDKFAYVYGSRELFKRKKPSGCCSDLLYGTDCSGLLYLAATFAGLGYNSVIDASHESLANSWAIPKSWGLTFKDVTKSVRASKKYQTGDIVYWSAGPHIGIMESSTSVIQSNGTKGCTSSGAEEVADCSANNNSDPKRQRGPRVILESSIENWGPAGKKFGQPNRILRLDTGANLDGTWSGPFTLPPFGECSMGASYVASFTFVDKNGENGGPITAKFNYSGSTAGAISFTGKRTVNEYSLIEDNGDRTYSGVLNVNPDSPELNTIDVSAPYYCNETQAPSPITFNLKRNESGNANSQNVTNRSNSSFISGRTSIQRK